MNCTELLIDQVRPLAPDVPISPFCAGLTGLSGPARHLFMISYKEPIRSRRYWKTSSLESRLQLLGVVEVPECLKSQTQIRAAGQGFED